jgi:hypothetical protein
MRYQAGPGVGQSKVRRTKGPRHQGGRIMMHITADSSPVSFTKMPLGYRLAWTLLGWGFDREDGFWFADAFLQDMPYRLERDIWWSEGTLDVRMRWSMLEISIEPRHIVRMVGVVKAGLLIAASVGLGWWLRG